MAFSKAKVAKLVAKGKKVAGDLIEDCTLYQSQEGLVFNPVTNKQEPTPAVEIPCSVLPDGSSFGRETTDISLPDDLIYWVFDLSEPIKLNDEIDIKGLRYKFVATSDESAGTSELFKVIVRALNG